MKAITNKQKKYIRSFIHYFLGPVLFVWVSYSIYTQVRQQPDLDRSWQHIKESFGSPLILNLVAVIILMVINWGIEAVKWKLSVRNIQRISLLTAFKAVLSGTSFSVTMPNRVGEYIGRVLYMEEGNRLKAVSLTIAGSMSQLIITLLMGLIGLLLLAEPIAQREFLSPAWIRTIIVGVSIVLVILTVFCFRLPMVSRIAVKGRWMKKYSWLISGLEGFNATLMMQLLSLSALRFLVFIVQYYLMFRLFGVEVSWSQAWCAMSVSFLVMAVIPTIALITDLGLRGKVSLKLLNLFSGNDLGIGWALLSIWLINLIIPALAGSLLILSIKKFFKNTTNEEGT
ncbi:MAG: flippase-like domain-containing protein [Chitinophagaceae bacterium]|nr:flippase-like domain-containing protein [Chitinophagaceae bacterium]